MEAIRFEQFSYHYPKTQRGLDQVSLSIPQGAFTVLTGANGSGKTSLCMAMTGLVPHFFGGSLSGQVEVAGKSTQGRSVAEIAAGIGLVMEDYESQLVSLTVFEEVAFAMENMALPAEEIRRRVADVLESVGLPGLGERELSALSGGQRQRLAIASVIASRPQILVLDEPTSALDPEGAAEIYALLSRLNREQGITVIVSEHDLTRALPYADSLIVMEQGRIVLDGVPREVFGRMLNGNLYAEAVPALRQLQAKLADNGVLQTGAGWITSAEASEAVNELLRRSRRLSLSA